MYPRVPEEEGLGRFKPPTPLPRFDKPLRRLRRGKHTQALFDLRRGKHTREIYEATRKDLELYVAGTRTLPHPSY